MPKEDHAATLSLRFLRRFLCGVLFLLLLCALTVFFMDPFYHYHRPWFRLNAVLTEKEYQIPGTLKHFDYDALLLGSSVVENSDVLLHETLFGTKTVKAIRSHGILYDLCAYADMAFAANDPSLVFFCIDAVALHGDTQEMFATYGCPMYLYDDNPFNDVRYLLNKDVLFRRIPYMLAQSASASYDGARPYNWIAGKTFSEEAALSRYERLPAVHEELPVTEDADAFLQITSRIASQVHAHPETTFIFFYPPYSVLWWDNTRRSGEWNRTWYEARAFAESMLAYENVRFYCFWDMDDVATDLDLYMDPAHFAPEINDRMAYEMADAHSRYLVDAGHVASYFSSAQTRLRDWTDTVIPLYFSAD